VSKLEFYVALALVALAQAGKGKRGKSYMNAYADLVAVDVSIEQVAALASQNTLPEPSLDLSSLQPSTSDFTTPTPAYRPPAPRSPAPNYSTDDPWNTARFTAVPGNDSLTNGAPSSLSGTGLPKDWWKKQETVNVNILGQQGFILNRYTVYEIISEVSV
jgi:sorting nexin-8